MYPSLQIQLHIQKKIKFTGYVKLQFSRILSMAIGNDNLVFALIVGLDLSDTKGDCIVFVLSLELISATFDDFCDTLVKFESRRWITFDLYSDVTNWIYKKVMNGYK